MKHTTMITLSTNLVGRNIIVNTIQLIVIDTGLNLVK